VAPVGATGGFDEIATMFGESASRVVVSIREENLEAFLGRARQADVTATRIGTVGGDRIHLSIGGRMVIDEGLRDAEQIWSEAIGSYFEKHRDIA
jgi:phosphoribosylformylglycinamidine synthase